MRCSDDRLFAYTYEPEDFRRVVSCCGDQEGVGPGWDDYTLMSVAAKYFCASLMAVAGLTITAVPRAARGG